MDSSTRQQNPVPDSDPPLKRTVITGPLLFCPVCGEPKTGLFARSCARCKTSFSTHARFVAVEIWITCPKCKRCEPLSGPNPVVKCRNCATIAEVPPEVWEKLLDIDDSFWEMRGLFEVWRDDAKGVELRYAAQVPRCLEPSCQRPLPAEILGPPEKENRHCPSCGETVRTAEAPAWLRKLVPAVTHIVGSMDQDGDDPTGSVARRIRAQRQWYICFEGPSRADWFKQLRAKWIAQRRKEKSTRERERLG